MVEVEEESDQSIDHSEFNVLSESHYTLETESKTEKSSVFDARNLYRVIFHDVDATPDPITHPKYVVMDEKCQHAAFDTRLQDRSKAAIREARSKSRLAQVGDGMKVYATTINLDDIQIDHTLNTEVGVESADGDLSIAPSAFYLPKMYPVTSYPKEIIVILKETETVSLFELPGITFDKGTAEGSIVEEENNYYEYITVGKGRNRKMVTQETQTKATIKQTRHTLATRPEKRNAMSFASMWDMHDTYSRIARAEEEEEEDEMVMYQSAARELLRKKKKKVVQEVTRGKTFEEIGAMPEFLDAVLLTERVLASLEYDAAQKTFRGLVAMDPLSLDLIYIYTLTPLWTYECEDTINKPISSISFNSQCPDICAIAHGKFGYADYCKGVICIWCTKNPREPERLYHFEDSVTAVCFSQKYPNWLACGFCNGDVIILDITSYSIKTIAVSKRDTNPCFEPIWVITWRTIDKDNYVIATCQDGRITRLQSTKTHDFISSPMMRVSTVEGKLKGLEIAKPCLKVDVPITRYPAVLCMIWHPTIDHCYLVGTDEGCIHRCSTHYLNQHMDVFRAHAGPVTDMCISPFMNYLLASSGSDHAIRLWIDGMDDVIMTLTCPVAVNSVSFCPVNSTILLATSGNVLSIWDLRRKIHMPCAEYTFPNNVTLTYTKFDPSGQNVFVGDTTGRLHTFHLEDTPIPPYDQTKMLDDAIRSALCTRPDMLKQLDKLLSYRERVKRKG